MSLPTPTALGVKALLFYLLMLGAYVATPYSNLFFMLLTFLTVLGALNVVWTLRNASGMRATVEEVEPVPAGAALPLRGVIESDGVALAIEMEVEGQIKTQNSNLTLTQYESLGEPVLEGEGKWSR